MEEGIRQNNNLINLSVRDLSDYLYCERKAYLKKILGLKEQIGPYVIKGRIKHEILDEFSKIEQNIVSSITYQLSYEELGNLYMIALKQITSMAFERNLSSAESFKLEEEEFWEGLWKELQKDIQLRVKAISLLLKKDIFGLELWEKLEPKYLTEYKIISPRLGLTGKIDRLMISEQDGKKVYIPFEVKSGSAIKPYESDLIQLSSYALLIEDKFNYPASKGFMEYKDRRIEIEITREMKQQALDIIQNIRNFPNLEKMPKIIENFKKCLKCGLREQCYEIG